MGQPADRRADGRVARKMRSAALRKDPKKEACRIL
jgi:hypothetical protein